MTALGPRGARYGLAVLGAGMLLCAATAGHAQPDTAPPQPAPMRDALSRNLHDLADNPRSVEALTGAGKAALDMGDAQAALAFFARAEDAAPRDGRVKALMAAALVQLEQPKAALKFFTDAVQLGCPEAALAGDRGLAWDIMGDPRRAQRDYRLALSRGPDAEISRRLALSLAIGGDREGALRQLADPSLAGDRATERTRALVLALNGDTAGAGRVVEAAMPGPGGQAMMPFLARLPQLGFADRALAVHLGHFPGDGRTSAAPPATYAASSFAGAVQRPATDAGKPDAAAPSLARLVAAAPAQTDASARRRPGETPLAAAVPARTAPSRTVVPRVTTQAEWSWSRGAPDPVRPKPTPAPVRIARADTPTVAVHRASEPAPNVVQPAVRTPEPEPLAPPVRASSRLADLEAAVETVADPVRPRVSVAARKPELVRLADARPEPKKKPEPRKPAPKPEPSRAWVQIAVAGERSALPREFARLKAKAPKLFGAHGAWTAPLGATNRLLVGPFPTSKEAQAFVKDLDRADLGGFAWTSDEGEKVLKLPAQ